MAEKITVNVPHKLAKEDVKSRIDKGFSKVQEEIAGKSVEVTQIWQADAMNFTAGLMGQKITGKLNVHDKHVLIEVDLPWFLAKLAGPVKEKLSRGTQLLLDKK